MKIKFFYIFFIFFFLSSIFFFFSFFSDLIRGYMILFYVSIFLSFCYRIISLNDETSILTNSILSKVYLFLQYFFVLNLILSFLFFVDYYTYLYISPLTVFLENFMLMPPYFLLWILFLYILYIFWKIRNKI